MPCEAASRFAALTRWRNKTSGLHTWSLPSLLQAQARWELQHLRPDWSVWESKAAEEGRWLRDRAQKQATVLSRKARDTYDSDPKEYARRQGRMHPSDSDLDRLQVLGRENPFYRRWLPVTGAELIISSAQGKVKAAADRVEEKRKRPVGRQRYFEVCGGKPAQL